MATRPPISAKNKTDILHNKAGLHAASEGGVGFTLRGSRSTVDIASCTALAKTPCVEGGTHPKLCRAQQSSITRSRTPSFHRRIRSLTMRQRFSTQQRHDEAGALE